MDRFPEGGERPPVKYRYKDMERPFKESVRVTRPAERLPKAYAVEERLPKTYSAKLPKSYRMSPAEERVPKVYATKRYISRSPPPDEPGPSGVIKSRQADYPGYRLKRKSFPTPDGPLEEKRPRRPPSPVYSDASGYSKTPTPPPIANTDDDF